MALSLLHTNWFYQIFWEAGLIKTKTTRGTLGVAGSRNGFFSEPLNQVTKSMSRSKMREQKAGLESRLGLAEASC